MIPESKDKSYYDESPDNIPFEALRQHCAVVRKYIDRYVDHLDAYGLGRKLRVLELGAGSCVTSLVLSNLDCISEIVCLDISIKKMRAMFPESVRAVEVSSPTKISMVEGHFDAPLPFAESEFDVVVFDGALHHARSMWSILEECKRVLRTDGVLIAQREQYLGPLTASLKLRRLLQTPEVKAGVSENAYLPSQYEYYLRAVGFGSVSFWPVAETASQRLLGLLNGAVFSKWVIWAHASP